MLSDGRMTAFEYRLTEPVIQNKHLFVLKKTMTINWFSPTSRLGGGFVSHKSIKINSPSV